MTKAGIDLQNGSSFDTVAKKLEMDIESQGLADGSRLMPLRQLSEKYDTSYQTMRKAINMLVQKGLLSSRQGSGIYVASKDSAQSVPARQKISMLFCGFQKYIATERFYSRVLIGATEEADKCDAEISVSLLRDTQEFMKRDVYSSSSGFLLIGEDVPGLAEAFKGKPAVWVMGGRKKWGDHISYDNRLVGVFAAEELVAAGRKNLACISVDAIGDERCRAFKEHAESLGAKVLYMNNPEALIRNESEQRIDFDALNGWADRIEKERPDLNGVFVVDMVAPLLCNRLEGRGIKLGRDIEIATASWQDTAAGSIEYKPINIFLQQELIGAMALRQLRWRMENPGGDCVVMRIEPKIDRNR